MLKQWNQRILPDSWQRKHWGEKRMFEFSVDGCSHICCFCLFEYFHSLIVAWSCLCLARHIVQRPLQGKTHFPCERWRLFRVECISRAVCIRFLIYFISVCCSGCWYLRYFIDTLSKWCWLVITNSVYKAKCHSNKNVVLYTNLCFKYSCHWAVSSCTYWCGSPSMAGWMLLYIRPRLTSRFSPCL